MSWIAAKLNELQNSARMYRSLIQVEIVSKKCRLNSLEIRKDRNKGRFSKSVNKK